MIFSGPSFGMANPVFKCARKSCELNSDYDNIDLTSIDDSYMQRCKYDIACSSQDYFSSVQKTPWGTLYTDNYRVITRRMLNQGGERTLFGAIIPQMSGHINTVYGLAFKDVLNVARVSGMFESLPYDFFVKATGKNDAKFSTLALLPFLKGKTVEGISTRSLLLNCLTKYYSNLWQKCFNDSFTIDHWSKSDVRLDNSHFNTLTLEWTWNTPLRTDYERRQALVEIDVLTAMALGMTLQQLKTIYRIQFPVLQSYEADTWYDANGRITFTNNRSLTGVGFSRPEWENAGAVQPVRRSDAPWDGVMKHAPAGYVFARTIMDDTMPGGPVERTIEYVAPFDCCDREQDYETAWKFFEAKYGKEQ